MKPAGSEGTQCRGLRIRAPSGSGPSTWLPRPIACVRRVREPSAQALANVCMGVLSGQAGCSLSRFSRAVCSSRWPLSTMPSLELLGEQTRERRVWDLYTTGPGPLERRCSQVRMALVQPSASPLPYLPPERKGSEEFQVPINRVQLPLDYLTSYLCTLGRESKIIQNGSHQQSRALWSKTPSSGLHVDFFNQTHQSPATTNELNCEEN